jgi:MFS transporter, NNP family, nitrate/nitrite transporter
MEQRAAGLPFNLVAIVLAIYALVSYFLLRDRPDRAIARGSMLSRTVATLKIPATLQLAFLYAVAFGGYVAFSVYLPWWPLRQPPCSR